MSKPVVTASEQLVITVIHDYKHRPNKRWFGCLEVERKDYSYADILKLANDDPETIVKVYKIGKSGMDDISDAVLDWEEANRK